MAFAYPSGTNTFIPDFDATGQLVAAYSRNPKDFSLNKYVTITPVKKMSGYFMQITAEQAARVLNANAQDMIWPPGNDAPEEVWGNESFQWVLYNTTRYAPGFRIPYEAEEQADWKILAAYAAFVAQQQMTVRTKLTVAQLTNTANFGTTFATGTAAGGGSWASGTSTSPFIMKSLNTVAISIQQQTLGVIRPQDLVLVVSPTVAHQMAESAELHDYLKGSPYAWPALQAKDGVQTNAGQWGLPDYLYGYKVVVEDAVAVSTQKLQSPQTKAYLLGSQAALIARPGGLTSVAGGPSFSFIHLFVYEDMTVEQRQDPDNRRIKGRVVDNFVPAVVSPISGGLISNVLA